eukprot:10610337-Lingulodinium_polyedra.AAC.1
MWSPRIGPGALALQRQRATDAGKGREQQSVPRHGSPLTSIGGQDAKVGSRFVHPQSAAHGNFEQ